MNFHVFAFTTPAFAPVADITVPALRAYCARHGYALTISEGEDLKPGGRPLGFIKTERALEVLRTMDDRDFLFVVDLDWLVTNHTVKLETLGGDGYDIFCTADVNGFNAGALLIRRSFWGIEFLNGTLRCEGREKAHGEQDAMSFALEMGYRGVTKFLPQRTMNSYLYTEYPETQGVEEPGHWQPGDFALHLPGRSNERRVEIFNSELVRRGIVR